MLLALLAALGIGVSLGLMGSGGSILTVPALVYVIGQDEKIAIAGSLGIVGIIAGVAGARAAWHGQVHWRSVTWFGLPGMLGTFGGAWLGGFVAGYVQLLTLVLVTLLASLLMLRPEPPPAVHAPAGPRTPWRSGLDGITFGTLTGFVGVGGGFLIVPALVLRGGLSMQRAIGSSLVIITLQSGTGFVKYHHVLQDLHQRLDWPVLGTFAAVGVLGSLAGGSFGKRLPQHRLRRVFATILLLVATAMAVATTARLLRAPGHGPAPTPAMAGHAQER